MQLKRQYSTALVCLGALLASLTEAQNPAIVDNPPSETAFENLRIQFSYPGTFQFVRRVDFQNLPVHLFDSSGEVETVLLRNGAYERHDQFGFEELSVESVRSLPDVSKSGRQYTLVVYREFYGGGSSNTDGLAQVFVLSQRRLQVTQQLKWDEHFAAPEGWYMRFQMVFSPSVQPAIWNWTLTVASREWTLSRFVGTDHGFLRIDLSQSACRNVDGLPLRVLPHRPASAIVES